jgi:alkylated DNA repair dioxygenase AlkB
MDDLFSHSAGFDSLPMTDANVSFWHQFYPAARAAGLMQKLLQETPWRQEQITVWGKAYSQPRLSAWYADPGVAYAYSGLTLTALDWTDTLQDIRHEIETACSQRFNSVLLNLYRDGQDSMGWHSDDEAELGRNPVIASLSLGATRIFKFRHKNKAQQKPLAVELNDGSLLLMAGETQHHWLHGVGKQSRRDGARINLTFRQVLSATEPEKRP